MYRFSPFLLTFVSLCILSSCKKDNIPPTSTEPNSNSVDTIAIWTLFDETSGSVFNRITDIEVKDFGGGVWVSSYNESTSWLASKIVAFDDQLSITQTLDSTNSPFFKSKITSFGFDMAGKLHFGTLFETNTVVENHLVTKNGTSYSNYVTPSGPFSSNDDDFEEFHFNPEGLWFGTGNEGLIRFQNGTFTIYEYPIFNIPPPGTVKDFIKINTSDFWFSTHNGLIKKTGSTFEIAQVNVDPDAMDIDALGNLWIASESPTDYFTLHKFDGTTTTVIEIPILFAFNIGISDLVCDNYNNIWVATGGEFANGYGLYKYDGVNWTHFTTGNSSLHSDDLTKLEIDDEGNLWIGSMDAGVIRLNKFGTLHE